MKREPSQQCNTEKDHSSAAEPRDVEMGKMPDKDFKCLLVKVISDLEGGTDKRMNSIQTQRGKVL